MPSFVNIAFYKFVPLEKLEEMQASLRSFCVSKGIKGTILLAPEGMNGSLAGEKEAILAFQKFLTSNPRFSDLTFKESLSDFQPFDKMFIKLKKEIVTMRAENWTRDASPAPQLPPAELDRWYAEKKDFLLIDTRNDYEYKIGTFEKAYDIGIENFRDFPAKVAALPEEWKNKPIVTFCTGGIRCEKAAPYMISQGFKNIYQLEGGILNYFKERGQSHWQGECFVFDNRIAVNAKLEATGATLCETCEAPIRLDQENCPLCSTPKALKTACR